DVERDAVLARGDYDEPLQIGLRVQADIGRINGNAGDLAFSRGCRGENEHGDGGEQVFHGYSPFPASWQLAVLFLRGEGGVDAELAAADGVAYGIAVELELGDTDERRIAI